MLRYPILFIGILLSCQFAFGQSGDYSGTSPIFDTTRHSIHLSLKEEGLFILQYPAGDPLATLTGKWRRKRDKIKLTPKYSKADKTDKSNGVDRPFVLNIEGDRLVWKAKPVRNTRRFERQMSREVGEKVT